jgi:hypothetical protein
LSHEIRQAESTTQSASASLRGQGSVAEFARLLRQRERERRLGEPLAGHEPVGGKKDDAVIRRRGLDRCLAAVPAEMNIRADEASLTSTALSSSAPAEAMIAASRRGWCGRRLALSYPAELCHSERVIKNWSIRRFGLS